MLGEPWPSAVVVLTRISPPVRVTVGVKPTTGAMFAGGGGLGGGGVAPVPLPLTRPSKPSAVVLVKICLAMIVPRNATRRSQSERAKARQ